MTQVQLQQANAPSHDQPADKLPYIDATDFREALSRAATAVTIIATEGSAGKAGVTCSAVCSVSDTPPTILFCVNQRSAANSVIKSNGLLSVNWLQAQQADVSQLFSGVGHVPMHERFNDTRWQVSVHGIPYHTDALVSLDCRIASAMEIGTHSVFVAHVLNARTSAEVAPLVYCQRAYATTRPTQS
ncbi:flavin reductase [Paraburkholderia pallida]|uniref:NAD(FAD)-dependent dehydrogenase n=1 Tax=Paraburkholderia pallida TaxID=2547399 RepID=A0A4P7CUQ8_9BURK|nr:flavin reductase [Paraburkholderia pallida]QBQ99850.1 NAD(FAD)-dependent dehydrogenase [Paraburkholderia pallida]